MNEIKFKSYKPLVNVDESFELIKRSLGNYLRIKRHTTRYPGLPEQIVEAIEKEIGKSEPKLLPLTIEEYYVELVDMLFGAQIMADNDYDLINMDEVNAAVDDFFTGGNKMRS